VNFLQLAQRLRLECGVGGTGPTTVASQTGEMERLVTWIGAAWQDVQTAHTDWEWMRASASFTTVASQATYALGTIAGTVGVAAASFGRWARHTGRCYLTATGTNDETHIDWLGYDEWRDAYQFSAIRASDSRPVAFTVTPGKGIGLGPVPLVGYTVTLDYYTAPGVLVVDGDIPGMPVEFHLLIVYKAMMMYGAFESAPEVYQRGELEYGKLMERLRLDRLPEVTMAGPLA